MEKQRFYQGTSKPIMVGENRGKRVSFTFRNDNMQLAQLHAEQIFRSTDLCPYGPLEVATVSFLGTSEPSGLGEMHLINKGR